MAAARRRKIVYEPLDDLVPDPRNAKLHADEDIDASIARFGFTEPGLVDERTGLLISGHGRRERLIAKRDAGEDPPDGVVVKAGVWLVPVIRGWSSTDDDEALAYLIAANQLVAKGGWDTATLADHLTALDSAAAGLVGTGFDADYLDDLIAELQENASAFHDQEGYDSSKDAHAEKSIEDRAAEYARKGIRSLVLDYKINDFDEVAAMAARVRRARGIETNADLVATLIREAHAGLGADEVDGAVV